MKLTKSVRQMAVTIARFVTRRGIGNSVDFGFPFIGFFPSKITDERDNHE
jgi:hypothetical protein